MRGTQCRERVAVARIGRIVAVAALLAVAVPSTAREASAGVSQAQADAERAYPALAAFAERIVEEGKVQTLALVCFATNLSMIACRGQRKLKERVAFVEGEDLCSLVAPELRGDER